MSKREPLSVVTWIQIIESLKAAEALVSEAGQIIAPTLGAKGIDRFKRLEDDVYYARYKFEPHIYDQYPDWPYKQCKIFGQRHKSQPTKPIPRRFSYLGKIGIEDWNRISYCLRKTRQTVTEAFRATKDSIGKPQAKLATRKAETLNLNLRGSICTIAHDQHPGCPEIAASFFAPLPDEHDYKEQEIRKS